MVTKSDTALTCSQCGGELYPDEGQLFINCPYCASALFVSTERIVFHWYLDSTFDPEQAEASLARWLSKVEIGLDLGNDAQLTQSSFTYFPFWMIRMTEGENEEIVFEPAAATSVTEIRNLHLPGGNFLKYSEEIASHSLDPTIPLPSLIKQLDRRGKSEDHIAEIAFIHIPIYTLKYTYRGREYTALVEGSSGEVFSNIYPEKPRGLYVVLSVATALTFICLATLPCIGNALDIEEGRRIGLALSLGLGALFGIVVVAIAGWLAGER
jgi:hypothetical protein